jgi:N-methylhydantoinase A
MSYRLGIDIGGTFTDFTVIEPDGTMAIHKVPTTPWDPTEAVFTGLSQIAAERGTDLQGFLAACEHVIHGTTISTNAVIQRSGAKTGLLCTEGFRDILDIGDGRKPEVYNLKLRKPDPIIPRYLRLGVPERIDYSGAVLRDLDEQVLARHVERMQAEGIEAIAVAFLWSNVNPEHERRALEIVRQQFPGVPVVASSDVLPLIREWPRTCAAVLSAYIHDGIAAYLGRIQQLLASNGLERQVLIVQCTGGSATVDEIVSRPVYSLLSGPAAAPVAALMFAEASGSRDIISIDMGGTSFDVCLMQNGDPIISNDLRLSGIPLGVMATDIHSIGAGGGSIAWIDSGGALSVGPRSAGAHPGPACYGRGGELPTVTDANLILGYLNPDHFLGGAMRLYPAKAEEAIRTHVAEPLGMTTTEAAAGIFKLVNFHMVQGIAYVSIERGLDPRGFVLVAGGGAGPAHSGMLAEELGIRQVIVPRQASALSAAGMATSDVTQDHMRTVSIDSTALTAEQVNAIFREMEEQAAENLVANGIARDRIRFRRFFDASYVGQVHELMVPAPDGDLSSIDELIRRFHEAHERSYTYRIETNPVQFYHWRIRAVGEIDHLPRVEQPNDGPDAAHARKPARKAYFEALGGYVETPVYDGAMLRHGNTVTGPAIVEDTTTNIVVFPGHLLAVNCYGDYSYTLRQVDGA